MQHDVARLSSIPAKGALAVPPFAGAGLNAHAVALLDFSKQEFEQLNQDVHDWLSFLIPGCRSIRSSSPPHHSQGARATENRILLEQVCAIGESQLRQREWELLKTTAADGVDDELPRTERNRLRVNLHRARKKLKEITGWE
jgi:hypothetical protein